MRRVGVALVVGAVLLGAALVSAGPRSEGGPDPVHAPVTARLPPRTPTPPTTAAWRPPPPVYRPAPIPASSSPEAKGAAALAVITFPIEQTGYTVVFSGPRPGVEGWTSSAARTITVYVRPSQTADDVARVLAHELGHVVDHQLLDDDERRRFREMRRLDDRSWYPCEGCADDSSPAGDFAEVFAWWLRGPGSFKSRLAPPPSDLELERISPLWR